MTGLVIFLGVGSFLAYIRMRKTWLRTQGSNTGWDRIIVCLLSASISWFGLLLALSMDKTSKPPKWM
jgi:hypothetical protein